MVESCSELDENVEGKDDINEGVQDQEVHTLHNYWIKTELERNAESVVEGQDDDEKFPLGFSWVILTYHKCLILSEHLLEDL